VEEGGEDEQGDYFLETSEVKYLQHSQHFLNFQLILQLLEGPSHDIIFLEGQSPYTYSAAHLGLGL
jgi:hypothetical protein